MMKKVCVDFDDTLRIENTFYRNDDDFGALMFDHTEDTTDKMPLVAEVIKKDGQSVSLKPYDTVTDGYGNHYLLVDGANGARLVDKASLTTDEFKQALAD
ncbi:hypothetical protein HMPREF0501_01121 [Limosilactobacillus coleohominis 101-4-CHN]|uniref:Uncharacterized protein n=1 Tax=Limosilactobacillus coleohominis 101-4-CHN TaxID=575594 RepID=C7XW56_9LACO|nr:hypothetical protein [Limosilactobacillus coleohominis]EEU30116.1 hypothetical protein HMPREF0501_01121 [Limosilactobacillus coleohominis 101-4-CHN]